MIGLLGKWDSELRGNDGDLRGYDRVLPAAADIGCVSALGNRFTMRTRLLLFIPTCLVQIPLTYIFPLEGP